MTKRVIFTRNKTKDEVEELYTRITTEFEHQETLIECVGLSNDPLLKFIKFKDNKLNEIDNIDVYLVDNMVIDINILFLDNGDFKQYSGRIDMKNFESIRDSGLGKDIDMVSLYVWIYGLIVNGKYDDDKWYRFEFANVGDKFYWLIKVYDNGIFKTILSLDLERCDEIDMDEFFLEDLETFWKAEREHKRKEDEWLIEREKMMKEMGMLREKTGIKHLQNSLKDMKSKITDYFLPLINNLLLEKKKLMDGAGFDGDTLFRKAVRRRNDGEDETYRNIEEPVERPSNDIDAFLQQERNKRFKLAENPSFVENDKVEVDDALIKKEDTIEDVQLINDGDTEEDSIEFEGRKRVGSMVNDESSVADDVIINELEPEIQNLIDDSSEEDENIVILEENTEDDEGDEAVITDISTDVENEKENDQDQDSDVDTLLSGSEGGNNSN